MTTLRIKEKPLHKKTMRIQARFTVNEWREIEKKAHLYTNGNFSEWIRLASLSFKKDKKAE